MHKVQGRLVDCLPYEKPGYIIPVFEYEVYGRPERCPSPNHILKTPNALAPIQELVIDDETGTIIKVNRKQDIQTFMSAIVISLVCIFTIICLFMNKPVFKILIGLIPVCATIYHMYSLWKRLKTVETDIVVTQGTIMHYEEEKRETDGSIRTLYHPLYAYSYQGDNFYYKGKTMEAPNNKGATKSLYLNTKTNKITTRKQDKESLQIELYLTLATLIMMLLFALLSTFDLSIKNFPTQKYIFIAIILFALGAALYNTCMQIKNRGISVEAHLHKVTKCQNELLQCSYGYILNGVSKTYNIGRRGTPQQYLTLYFHPKTGKAFSMTEIEKLNKIAIMLFAFAACLFGLCLIVT